MGGRGFGSKRLVDQAAADWDGSSLMAAVSERLIKVPMTAAPAATRARAMVVFGFETTADMILGMKELQFLSTTGCSEAYL